MTKRWFIIGSNMLIMMGYSTAYIWQGERGQGGWPGQDLVISQWSLLVLHIGFIFILGWIKDRTREVRQSYLLAALFVALVGHGLCFYNGTANAAWN
jgi:hypothetical protein